jgi:hypothetical protein
MVRSLVWADLSRKLGYRLLAWAGTAFSAWSLAILAAVVLAETAYAPSPLSFHAFVMAALGSLPAFLAAPFRAGSGLEAVRRSDREAAVESWLGYAGGPAERILATRASEALSVASLTGFGRPRPSRAARTVVAWLFAAGLAAFLVAQVVSVRSGYGISLTYPDKEIPDFVAERDAATDDAYDGIVAPGAALEEEEDAPGERRYAGSGPKDDDALAEPDFVSADGTTPDFSQGDAEPGETGSDSRKAPQAARSSRDGAGRSAPAAGTDNAAGGKEAGSDSSGEARAPGWEGLGRAIDASPLVDYRARFERQLAETSGRETALGNQPSAELVSAAVAEFYASFDARVAVGAPADPAIVRVQEAWRRAFGTEAGR